MNARDRPGAIPQEFSRRTLRLTFRSSDAGVELLSVDRLEMITPPQPGERPEAGKHGGHWLELHDGGGQVLAYSLINPSVLNSVEVHSPDGSIERHFGAMRNVVFEVFLPDIDGARTAVLVGTPLEPSRRRGARAEVSSNIATFELPEREGGAP
jgi:hypothetical protein